MAITSATSAPSRKRPRDEPRPNLAKIDDYRCVIWGDLSLAMAETLDDSDLVWVVPCGHHFHRGCISLWAKQRVSPSCPSCRAPIQEIQTMRVIHSHAAMLRQERQHELALKPHLDVIQAIDALRHATKDFVEITTLAN